MSLVLIKTAFCTCENKVADQLCGNRTDDRHLCFRYMDSTVLTPLLSKSENSSLLPSSVTVQPGLCGTWSETPKTGFLTTSSTMVLIEIVFLELESSHGHLILK